MGNERFMPAQVAACLFSCRLSADRCRVPQLYAKVMLKEPLYLSRVRSCLEKALDKDPSHLPAAYLLAEIYEKVSIVLSGRATI